MTGSDAQIAREWASKALDNDLLDEVPIDGYRAAARYILATTTPPTMADVEWDDAVHAGLCALCADGDLVRMIGPSLGNGGAIICHWVYCDSTVTGALPAENLTPLPSTRLDLTPRREPEPESTPDHPAVIVTEDTDEPEDVKPDPQPGEAWLIEYEGKRYEAIYWYSPIYAHWAFVESREGLKTVESPEATPVSRMVPEEASE